MAKGKAGAQQVGEIYYDVTLETSKMVDGQRQVDRALKTTTSSLDGFEARLTSVARAITAYASALWVIQQADSFTKLNAQLKLATDNTQDYLNAQRQVKAIAQEAQTDIMGVGTLYARITTATKELGTSQAQVAAITRTVALALKVSGAGAQESASATLQLSQAFASGVLRGEEFNSVSEAAPRLMRALADGIGVPVGQLRSLAEAGKLTSDVLANALPKALNDLEKEAKQVQTISGAFQQLRNEVMLFVGEQTSASGAARLTADAIGLLASNLDLLAAAAYGYATAKLATMLLDASRAAAINAKSILDNVAAQQASRAAAIAAAQAEVEKAKAQIATLAATKQAIIVAREQYVAELQLMNAFKARGIAMAQIGAATTQLATLGRQQASVAAQQAAANTALAAAQGGLAAATTAAGTAARLATGALGLLGGPIGAITTVLGLGVTAWAMWGDAAKTGEQKAVEEVERSTQQIVEDLDKQIAKLRERNSLAAAGLGGIAKQDTEAAKKLAGLQGQIDNLMAGKGPTGGAALPEEARVGLLQTLLGQYAQLAGKIQEIGVEQQKLEATGAASKLSQWMLKYASDTEKAREEIAKAKKELGSAFTPDLEKRIREKFSPPKAPKESFDQVAYLATIRSAQADELAAITSKEDEALRIAKKHLDAKQIDQKTYNEAVTLIYSEAENDRVELTTKANEKLVKDAERMEEESIRNRRRLNDQRTGAQISTLSARAGSGNIEDRVALVRAQAQAEMAAIEEHRLGDLQRSQLYADQKVAIEEDMNRRIADMRASANQTALAATSEAFGAMVGVLKQSAGEQTGIYQVMFAAQKAFSIASSVIAIQEGIAKASSLQWPANLAAMASVVSATASIVSTIQGTNYGGGRQYGGPVTSGSLYRVNEGGRPEMFTAANGAQYMLPTANGNVTPAGAGGGGQAPTVIIQCFGAQLQEQSRSYDKDANQLTLLLSAVAEQIGSNSGPIWNAMKGSTNIQGRL